MEQGQFKVGAEWALRKTRGLLQPAERVALVALVRRSPRNVRVKVQHLDGDLAGFEEFVLSAHLLTPWKDWSKVLNDEEREGRLIEHVEARGVVDRVVADAATNVLEASQENLYVDELRGSTRHLDPAALDREESAALRLERALAGRG